MKIIQLNYVKYEYYFKINNNKFENLIANYIFVNLIAFYYIIFRGNINVYNLMHKTIQNIEKFYLHLR